MVEEIRGGIPLTMGVQHEEEDQDIPNYGPQQKFL